MPDGSETVFKADCPSRAILDQVADKWSVIILGALCDRPLRFNELRRRIDGVTQRALTQALRRLERNGIVTRTVAPGPPVAVSYALTPLGRTLEEPFAALYAWTLKHLPELEAAQRRFDAP
ncbi:helix-turn-helix domain-containing protein [Phenylobacterium sp.]|uniref:winged helix-turn-helix transcriptional regulator n=1 Tax=Phenylobacterium sp. TaxID=1871053 RepID=UPI00301C2E12